MKTTRVCAVTKSQNLASVQSMLLKHPYIKDIAENRWPDCQEKFQALSSYTRHFIGPLQSNKIRKILPLVEVIQSIDSLELLKKVNRIAGELSKTIQFCFQVNISLDPSKKGFKPSEIHQAIIDYLHSDYPNLQLIGLMTIGSNSSLEIRRQHFQAFKKLFDQINQTHFPTTPLPHLSMGMSSDYQIAIEEGATIIRPGTALFSGEFHL